MKAQETMKSDNELIAEFMGLRSCKTEHDTFWLESVNEECTPENWQWTSLELGYNASWDWLMPVVEKIESLALFSFRIGKQFVRIEDVDPFNMRTAISVAVIGRPKIQAVYQAVVEFIKWYNQNKVTHES